VRRETTRSWDKRPDWGRPGTVFRTSQKGRLERAGYGAAEIFANKVKVTKSDGQVKATKCDGYGLRWVAQKEFDGEVADLDVSAADGVKEGGVGRGAESTRYVGGEGSVFKI
jgi:hypothetical protein